MTALSHLQSAGFVIEIKPVLVPIENGSLLGVNPAQVTQQYLSVLSCSKLPQEENNILIYTNMNHLNISCSSQEATISPALPVTFPRQEWKSAVIMSIPPPQVGTSNCSPKKEASELEKDCLLLSAKGLGPETGESVEVPGCRKRPNPGLLHIIKSATQLEPPPALDQKISSDIHLQEAVVREPFDSVVSRKNSSSNTCHREKEKSQVIKWPAGIRQAWKRIQKRQVIKALKRNSHQDRWRRQCWEENRVSQILLEKTANSDAIYLGV